MRRLVLTGAALQLFDQGDGFVQEDSPHEIGQAVASWMKKLR